MNSAESLFEFLFKDAEPAERIEAERKYKAWALSDWTPRYDEIKGRMRAIDGTLFYMQEDVNERDWVGARFKAEGIINHANVCLKILKDLWARDHKQEGGK